MQLSVLAQGTPPLTYQWQLNGKDVTGATEAAYAITNAKFDQGGDYTVVVKNGFGNKTSAVAKVTCWKRFPAATTQASATIARRGRWRDRFALQIGLQRGRPKLRCHRPRLDRVPDGAGPWLANSDLSKWISPRFDTTEATTGDYLYRLGL